MLHFPLEYKKTASTEDVRHFLSHVCQSTAEGGKIAIFGPALPNRNRILNHKNNHSGSPTQEEVSWQLNGNFSCLLSQSGTSVSIEPRPRGDLLCLRINRVIAEMVKYLMQYLGLLDAI